VTSSRACQEGMGRPSEDRKFSHAPLAARFSPYWHGHHMVSRPGYLGNVHLARTRVSGGGGRGLQILATPPVWLDLPRRPDLAAAYAASQYRARHHLLHGGRHNGSGMVAYRALRGPRAANDSSTIVLHVWRATSNHARRKMTSPEMLGRLYPLALAAIAVIGVVIVFIVGLVHVWPYALAGAAVLLVGFAIPIILGMANM